MKRRLVILGDVQNVGYRPFLLGIAEALDIEHFFADNAIIDERRVVHIMVDSSQDKVDSFVEIVSSKYPENASVEEVEVEDYSGNVMKTESYYRYLTAMQLHKIATYGGIMIEKQDDTLREIRVVGEKVDVVGEKVDAVGAKVDVVGEKVDAVGAKVDVVGEKVDAVGAKVDVVGEKVDAVGAKVDVVGAKVDAVGAKVDAVGKKQDKTIEEIKITREGFTLEIRSVGEKVDNVHGEQRKTNEILEERFGRMQKDIEKIKIALTKAGIEI